MGKGIWRSLYIATLRHEVVIMKSKLNCAHFQPFLWNFNCNIVWRAWCRMSLCQSWPWTPLLCLMPKFCEFFSYELFPECMLIDVCLLKWQMRCEERLLITGKKGATLCQESMVKMQELLNYKTKRIVWEGSVLKCALVCILILMSRWLFRWAKVMIGRASCDGCEKDPRDSMTLTSYISSNPIPIWHDLGD